MWPYRVEGVKHINVGVSTKAVRSQFHYFIEQITQVIILL